MKVWAVATAVADLTSVLFNDYNLLKKVVVTLQADPTWLVPVDRQFNEESGCIHLGVCSTERYYFFLNKRKTTSFRTLKELCVLRAHCWNNNRNSEKLTTQYLLKNMLDVWLFLNFKLIIWIIMQSSKCRWQVRT